MPVLDHAHAARHDFRSRRRRRDEADARLESHGGEPHCPGRSFAIDSSGGAKGLDSRIVVAAHHPQSGSSDAGRRQLADGIDGTEDNAGAVWSPELGKRSGARQALERHDSYGFFKDAGTLVVTGPTRTNVNDYRAILVR